jgi:hydroxymethylpyrimidine pyrophosphatase-like HAD family hydrolase
MRYHALAVSFDETIARAGTIEASTAAGLRRLVASGRQLVLLSRRTVQQVVDGIPEHLFAWVVAEYGGVLWRPATGELHPLAERLPHPLIRRLEDQGVEPLSVGEVAAATVPAHEALVRQAIETEGLDLTVVADKDVVLALPPGVDKGTGLAAVLAELGLSFHNVVGVGDAETDLEFLTRCGAAAAVANAPDEVKQRCHLVTEAADGEGVAELIDRVVGEDLVGLDQGLAHRHLLLGATADDDEVTVPVLGTNVLLAGSSGTGKSQLAAGILERLTELDYQFCVLDPEGDHAGQYGAVTLGDRYQAPTIDQVMQELRDPGRRVVADLLAVRLAQLPAFLKGLVRRLQELWTETGRPHLLLLDEAHHFLPLPGQPGAFTLPRWVTGLHMATVNPEHVAPAALSLADTVVTLGGDADETLGSYCETVGEPCPVTGPVDLEPGHALAWPRTAGGEPIRFRIAGGATERRPHLRRWAESELNEAKSFYFRGPDDSLNLRAPTLGTFIELAGGVDEATWRHHLAKGEYSAWLRDGIRDPTLADQVAAIEGEAGQEDVPAEDSRRQVVDAILERYQGGHP